MAPEQKIKKRKGATDASPRSKKLKKSDPAEESSHVPRKNKAAVSIPEGVNEVAVKAKTSRKRAADFMDESATGVSLNTETETKKDSKKNKKTSAPTEEPESVSNPERQSKKAKKANSAAKETGVPTSSAVKKASKKSKKASSPEPEAVDDEVDVVDAQEEEIDDQTAALLKGFESSDDEEDAVDDGKAIENIPAIPDEKKLRKKLDKAAQSSDEPGVIYVGRIPHGFYEHQMREYFSQFGDITRLRLSRNPKTGKPRHFAFVEFSSDEVAAIVAKAMDKYLLFGHILQVRTISKEQVHEDLFLGANKRFRPMPRQKIEARKLRLPKSKEEWEKKTKNAEKNRKKQLQKLKEIGYEFEAPQLKTIEDLEREKVTEGSPENEPRLLTETAHEEEKVEDLKPAKVSEKAKKAKKVKEASEPDAVKTIKTKRVAKEAVVEAKAPKVKKTKKTKV